MNVRKAMSLANRWPKWMESWRKEAIKTNAKSDDRFSSDYVESLYDAAVEKTKEIAPIVDWFIHCLYKKGYKIVPKKKNEKLFGKRSKL